MVTLWTEANKEKIVAAQKLQAVIRGWLVRHRIALAGPGVLRRTGLANDEDLETCEESSRQDPMNYVAFTENGKTWWFDFATLWKWMRLSVEPTNPYTKVPLSVETRTRLRKLWAYRRRHHETVPGDPGGYEDRVRVRWTLICQVFADNGLGQMNPEQFLRLSKSDYIFIFRILRDDLQASLPTQSRHALSMIHRCLITSWTLPYAQFTLQCSYALMSMLLHTRREYDHAFYVLSALYRA